MVKLYKLMTRFNLRIFELLIDNSFSVRDLAKANQCSPAKITQFVKLFKEASLVKLRLEKNMKIVELNRSHPLTKELVSVIFIEKILGSKAFSALKSKVRAIGVYGSVVEGSVDRHSDIDLWILSDKRNSFSDSAQIRARLGKELSREANLKLLTPDNIKKLKKNDPIFFNELAYKSKILHGEAFD